MLASAAAVPLTLSVILASPVDVRANNIPSSATPHVGDVYGQQGERGLSLAVKAGGAAMNTTLVGLNLPSGYGYRDGFAVSSFLHSNPSLIPILRDAPRNIAGHFEDGPSLVLEVVSDPEGSESDRLFLFIQTRLPSDLAIERLHQLDDEWWLDAIPDDDKMTIDIERA